MARPAPQPLDPDALASLVRSAQRGQREAERALFDQHHAGVVAYCMVAAGGDRDSALDLAQETLVRAFRSLPQLREPERFSGWLFSIAANTCRTRLGQAHKRRTLLELFAVEQEAAPPDEARAREARIETVQRVLAELPDDQLKQIVQLKYGEPERTTRQIAAELDIPHGTVTVKLMRFRAAIKRQLLGALLEEASP
jgi:RNA polymerase sigma-70 factor (ECF subfamily)